MASMAVMSANFFNFNRVPELGTSGCGFIGWGPSQRLHFAHHHFKLQHAGLQVLRTRQDTAGDKAVFNEGVLCAIDELLNAVGA